MNWFVFTMCFVSSTVISSVPCITKTYSSTLPSWGSPLFVNTDQPPLGFKKGFFLQTFNPKVAVFGLTLYSTFMASATNSPLLLSVSALLFALTAFCATSTWALGGSAIRNHLRQDRIRKLVNTILVLLLAYTAFDLSGITSLMR